MTSPAYKPNFTYIVVREMVRADLLLGFDWMALVFYIGQQGTIKAGQLCTKLRSAHLHLVAGGKAYVMIYTPLMVQILTELP